MKKTVFFLLFVFLLCALFIKPDCLPQLVQSVETARTTKAHTAWKTEAENDGADVRSFDENLYYSESAPDHMVACGNAFAYVDNEVIVYFKDGTSLREKQKLFDEIGGKVIGCSDIINKYQVQLSDRKSFSALQALCLSLQGKKHIAFANCNIALHLQEDAVPDDPWIEPSGSPAAFSWSESNVAGGNWWLTATQMPSAWNYQSYFHPIRIGIVDSGFSTVHEDLQNKISFPSAYFRRSNNASSHGTHVAGIISANANNQIGITGICDNAELLCVDWNPIEGQQFWSTSERVITGVIALVKKGAKVINLSLGSSQAFEKNNPFWMTISMRMDGIIHSYLVASLLRRGYDFLIVQSAGNGDSERDPCDTFYNGTFCSVTPKTVFTGLTGISKQEVLNHIIIVGSCTSAHDGTTFYQSSFSNYGSNVSIYAPGSSVFSTDLMANGGYSYKSGTSMASPVVAGIAALTWSVNPELTGSQVKAILCDPQNTTYDVVNHYNETMDIPSSRMVNGKLCVQAAIRTLSAPVDPTEPETSEPDTTQTDTTGIVIDPDLPIIHPTIPFTMVHANGEEPLLTDRSDGAYIEKFRGEIGE